MYGNSKNSSYNQKQKYYSRKSESDKIAIEFQQAKKERSSRDYIIEEHDVYAKRMNVISEKIKKASQGRNTRGNRFNTDPHLIDSFSLYNIFWINFVIIQVVLNIIFFTLHGKNPVSLYFYSVLPGFIIFYTYYILPFLMFVVACITLIKFLEGRKARVHVFDQYITFSWLNNMSNIDILGISDVVIQKSFFSLFISNHRNVVIYTLDGKIFKIRGIKGYYEFQELILDLVFYFEEKNSSKNRAKEFFSMFRKSLD